MPIVPLADLAPLLSPRGALIGLDLGTKTIGVATSDPDRRLATGVETVARKTFSADAKRLMELAAERKAAGFVLSGGNLGQHLIEARFLVGNFQIQAQFGLLHEGEVADGAGLQPGVTNQIRADTTSHI